MTTEAERLLALKHYDILDTPPDGAFDRISAMAAQCFRAPIAIVSLVDEDRIWFKSAHGLSVKEIPRSPGLCASAILGDSAYVVNDAIHDVRTLANPLVAGEMGLRFYAAAPLVTSDGYRLGTINVIDFKPREFSPEDEALLNQFAALVMDQMELRLSARKTIASLSQLLLGVKHPQELTSMLTFCAWSNKIRLGERWMTFDEFIHEELGLAVTHGISPEMADSFLKAS